MTNEEKAKQIASNNERSHQSRNSFIECFTSAMDMAEWKEQQMIDKAVEWLKENVTYTHPRKGTEECAVNITAFIEAMKGE